MARSSETLNFKDKSFILPIFYGLIKLYLQVNIQPWIGNIFGFTVFRLLEMHFVKLLLPWYDLIISTPM